ncbi:recombinase XerD [Halogeometricum sp. CBA1124]|uniref:tyrosine-type recombinase/integrase n=1 Tax=Halogeometricum sp. CBA1124 TaxID=2668071 RepID=UPI001E3336C0|nr:recombinase XerD [Halogeometricum sp. CBA1124]
MTASEPDESEVAAAVSRYLRANGTSAQYRSTAESVLSQFETWLRRRGKNSFEAFETEGQQILRRYADRLAQRVEAGGISASSAQTYYNVISGFLGFCVRDGDLTRNPALADRAREPLPRDDEDHSQQFWTREARRRLVRHTNEVAYEAIEDEGMDARAEVRDRALVHVLAFTGVRGAEVFRVSGDDREGRQGLTWARVDTEAWTFRVWGKAQEWEDVSVPAQARDAIERWLTVLDPPAADWPVFPTSHAPSKYGAVRDALGADAGDARLDDADATTPPRGGHRAARHHDRGRATRPRTNRRRGRRRHRRQAAPPTRRPARPRRRTVPDRPRTRSGRPSAQVAQHDEGGVLPHRRVRARRRRQRRVGRRVRAERHRR